MAGSETHHELALPKLDKPAKVLIVAAPFYRDIADSMIAGATAALEQAGASWEIVEVPGALEIPTAIRLARTGGNYDAFVALGCVIRGETTHYETVCNDSSRALTLLGLDGVCLGNGILTVENRAQAEVRADPKHMNKGGGAAAAALHLLALARRWSRSERDVGFRPAGENIRIAGESAGADRPPE